MQIPFLPTEASTGAVQSDAVFLVLMALGLFFTGLVALMVLYFGIRYRRRYPGQLGRPITGSMAIEWGGIGFLTMLALAMFFWAGSIYTQNFNPPPNAMPIFITGKQWMWKAQHPTGQREINTLHVPIGQPVRLIMTSEDVIHDFYVPAFRIKTDVLPGRYTSLWFQATQPGTYNLFCSQYCGTGHSQMVGQVIVQTPADYQAWLGGGPQQSPAQIGAGLFQQLGCNACHRPDSQARAPWLGGIYGQPVHLNNGQTVTADDNYIRESIVNPTAKIVQGFQPIMPSFQGRVTEEQIFDLIAYIQSLGPSAPGAPAGTGQPLLPGVASPPPNPPSGLPPGTPPVAPSPGAVQPATTAQPLGPTPVGTQGPGPAAAQAGAALFTSQGCSSCHLSNGSGPGPSMVGKFGKQEQLSNGQSVNVDEAYVRESILDPTAKIVKGYQPIMPSFQGRLSDAQINELIAYIKSLAGQ